MKRNALTLTGLVVIPAAAFLSGCGGSPAVEAEIPVIEADAGRSFTTAAAERLDVELFTTVGGNVDYVYADTLTVPCDTNVEEYSVRKGDRLSEGDVIAVFDSSMYDYELRNCRIAADDAYARWQSSGSELDRLGYEQKSKELELVQYRIDLCTVKAPYDCIVWKTEALTPGSAVAAGTAVCSVAKPDEVYITVNDKKELFALGREVTLKFGTNSTFTGTVAAEPDSGSSRSPVLIKLGDGELERANAEAGNIASAGWASVSVLEYSEKGALCVPAKAVTTYSGSTYCYIMDSGERVRVPVEAGRTVNDMTVIISGLSEGDVVSY